MSSNTLLLSYEIQQRIDHVPSLLITMLEDHVHRVHSNRRRQETVTLAAMKIYKKESDQLRGCRGSETD